jgi:thiamine-monophosphate kinase
MKLNELDWVELLKKKTGKGKDVLVGIGDDCAHVRVGREKLLLKSDLFMEGVHFDKKKTSYKTIGIRAVSRVLSDFAACAGVPKFVGVSVGIPGWVKTKDLQSILSGIMFCSRKYEFSLVGGDTIGSSKLFLDVWAVGKAEKCVLRSTAKEGDYIFLTGPLGKVSFFDPFEPRIKEAGDLVKKFKVNAMIDISDGFALDLYRILKESKKGAVIYREEIPVTKGDSDLYRGEDYELIFTVDKTESRLKYLKRKFFLVGKIKKQSFGYKIQKGNKLKNVSARGYTHL